MLVGEIVGFVGDIDCDSRKPGGVPGKLVDTAKLNSLGWQAKISLYITALNAHLEQIDSYAHLF